LLFRRIPGFLGEFSGITVATARQAIPSPPPASPSPWRSSPSRSPGPRQPQHPAQPGPHTRDVRAQPGGLGHDRRVHVVRPQPLGGQQAHTRSSSSRLEIPIISGRPVPKCVPMSPRAAAPSSASRTAWVSTSASESPSSPRGCGTVTPPRTSGRPATSRCMSTPIPLRSPPAPAALTLLPLPGSPGPAGSARRGRDPPGS